MAPMMRALTGRTCAADAHYFALFLFSQRRQRRNPVNCRYLPMPIDRKNAIPQ